MIKSFDPKPFKRFNSLPTYVQDLRVYTLIGIIHDGYRITLGKLTVGDSLSAGNPLTHALFESFTDHGERMSVCRTRVCGCDREFWAVKNAMFEAGVEFENVTSCTNKEMMDALGDWFCETNPEIKSYLLMSQSCH